MKKTGNLEKMKKNKKFQLRLSGDLLEIIFLLQEKTSSSGANVIRDSLQAMDWLIKKHEEGYSIQLKKDDDLIAFPIELVFKL